MIRIPILRNPVPGSPAEELLNRMLAVEKQVEMRAYDLYRHRSANAADSATDWRQAESEMVCKPSMALSETGDAFHLRVALPGVDARSLRIAAVEHALVLEAECHHDCPGTVRVNELPCKTVYRKVALTEPIQVNTVTATLEHGLLQITAAKAVASLSAGGKRHTMTASA